MVKITISDEELRALDDAHEGVTAVCRSTGELGARASSWVLVFRAARRLEIKRFTQTVDKDRHSAVEALFHSTCIFPDRAKRDELLEQPGCASVPFACLPHILTLSGVDASGELSK
jgi:hypothetical protein